MLRTVLYILTAYKKVLPEKKVDTILKSIVKHLYLMRICFLVTE